MICGNIEDYQLNRTHLLFPQYIIRIIFFGGLSRAKPNLYQSNDRLFHFNHDMEVHESRFSGKSRLLTTTLKIQCLQRQGGLTISHHSKLCIPVRN